ncbi:MAG: DUF456 domain-containing protein [Chloroflexota bacterium]|nr:DUF456 domain-containing protein [Chloroflexota bacterium]
MPELAASLFVPVTVIAMFIGVFLSLVPVLPGSLIVWAIALVAGLIDGWTRITPAAMIVMSIIMVVSQLSDFWLPLLGVQTGGMGCLTSIGSFVGGIVGTIFIPIPIVGTLIGVVAGALLVEFLQRQQVDPAVQAGKQAAKLFAIGYAIRFISSLAIFFVYIFTLATSS